MERRPEHEQPFVTRLFTDFTVGKQTFCRVGPSITLKGLVSLSPSSLGLGPNGPGPNFLSSLQLRNQPSFAFTLSLTFFPSTVLPASPAMTAFMTFPISLALVAPVSAMAAVTAAAISSSDADAGR